MTRLQAANELAERTSDAYSFDNYGAISWRASALMLLRRGYTEREAEAILRSKWTRWAADNSKSGRYGKTTSADLERFLDSYRDVEELRRDVAELVAGTF